MGTVHQLRWGRLRRRPSAMRRVNVFWPGLLLILGILPIAAAIGSKAIALWPPHDVTASDIGRPHPMTGVVVPVVDGDTLDVGRERIRLIGIDALELHQTCRDGQAREWQCGRAAKTRLAELVSQGGVSCTPHSYDRYGRTLAVCSAGNIPDLGEMLVREGYAMNFALGHSGYPAAEREAQSARRGVWQGEYESPRNWRRRHPRAG